MDGKLVDYIVSNLPPEINALLKLMGIAVLDEEYRQLVNEKLGKSPDFQKRRGMLEKGFFSGPDLMLLVACLSG